MDEWENAPTTSIGWENADGWESPHKTPSFLSSLNTKVGAGIEAAANTAAGAVAFPAALIGAGLHGLNEFTQGRGKEFDYEKSFGALNEAMMKPLMERTTPLGQEYTENIGKAINYAGVPLMGHFHAGIPVSVRPSLPKVPKSLKEQQAEIPSSKFSALDALDKAKEEQAAVETTKASVKQPVPLTEEGVPIQHVLEEAQKGMEVKEIAPEEAAQFFENNASGESAASLEAQNRLQQEQSLGRERVVITKEGTVKPLIGVDAVDYQPQKGETVVQRGIGTDEWTVLDSTVKNPEAALERAKEQLNIPRGQRGAIDLEEASKAIGKLVSSLKEHVDSLTSLNLHHLTTKEDYLSKNIPGMRESFEKIITKADPPEKIIADSLAPEVKDLPGPAFQEQNLPLVGNTLKGIGQIEHGISRQFQSGLSQTASKFREHPLLLGTGRILNEGVKKAEYQVKQLVQPLKNFYSAMPLSERIELTKLFHREMFNDKQYTVEELSKAGFNKRQIDAYQMQRAAFAASLERSNKARAILGKEPITAENAYLASRWTGDWHAPILDKAGKLAWYVRTTTRSEANAAISHLKATMGDKLQLEGVMPTFRKESSKYRPDMPRDVMGAYQDMLKYFSDNPEVSGQIREAMKGFVEKKGYGTLGFRKHFLEKSNVRGFEGDRPWLSAKQNSNALIKSQMEYLTNAIRWSHAQESMGKLKTILENPDLLKQQPNAMELVKQVVANQFGLSSNFLAGIESGIAQLTGRSTSSIYKGVSGVKTLLYLQLLGANLAHIMATTIQPLITTPAQHRLLTSQGFSHNVAKTSMLALSDFSAGMVIHATHGLINRDINIPSMTKIGKSALKYAEDNGIITKNIFNESVNLGENKLGELSKQTLGATIALPEKMARLSTFMGFVHHLEASGKFKDQMQLFRRAEELTDNSLTSFRGPDRPMIVDKLGATGSLGYTFKSFLFNEFNQLSHFAREAGRGNPSPLIAHLGMLGVVGGALSIPMVNEMDGMWNVLKDFISEHYPQHYSKVMGPGIKGTIISHLPDFASYGEASKLTGAALQTRFGTDIADPEHPFKNVFPMAQDIKELVASTAAMTHPTSTTGTKAIYEQMPAVIKGQMETQMPVFKGPKQGEKQITLNPHQIGETNIAQYARSPQEELYRKLGLTALSEAKSKQIGYIAGAEEQRINAAKKTLGDRIFDAVLRKDQEQIEDYAKSYLQLNPNSRELEQNIKNHINSYAFTPAQRDILSANTIATVLKVKRRMDMENK